MDQKLKVVHHINRQTAKQREAAQANPRPSRVRFKIRVSGVGETRLQGAAALKFGATMMEEPSFTFGCVAKSTIAPGNLPLATAIVTRWLKTSNGLYYGAEMGFKVESADYNMAMHFSLTFEGSTLRSTASQGTMDDQVVTRGKNASNATAVQDFE